MTSSLWTKDIERFSSPQKENPLIFIGSSTIRLWSQLENDFKHLGAINRGFGGSEYQDIEDNLTRLIADQAPLNPQAIILYSGDNDLDHGRSIEQIYNCVQRIIWKVHEKISCKIVILSIKPSPARAHLLENILTLNSKLSQLANYNPQVIFINLVPFMFKNEGQLNLDLYGADGLHLSSKGYELWTKILTPQFESLFF